MNSKMASFCAFSYLVTLVCFIHLSLAQDSTTSQSESTNEWPDFWTYSSTASYDDEQTYSSDIPELGNEQLSKETELEMLKKKVRDLTGEVESLKTINSNLEKESKNLRNKLMMDNLFDETSTTKELEMEETTETSQNLTKTAYACEYTPLDISCEQGSIHVVSALYGRLTTDFCNERLEFPITPANCTGRSSDLTAVKKSCELKDSCSIDASNSNFGDPCVGIWKYLEVEYQCREI